MQPHLTRFSLARLLDSWPHAPAVTESQIHPAAQPRTAPRTAPGSAPAEPSSAGILTGTLRGILRLLANRLLEQGFITLHHAKRGVILYGALACGHPHAKSQFRVADQLDDRFANGSFIVERDCQTMQSLVDQLKVRGDRADDGRQTGSHCLH